LGRPPGPGGSSISPGLRPAGTLLVGYALEHAFLAQQLESIAEQVCGDPEAVLEFLEALDAEDRVAQDQQSTRPTLLLSKRSAGCLNADVGARTHRWPELQGPGYIRKTDTEVNMLLAIAAVLLILAVIGGIAVHPLLFLIAVLAVVALVAGR